MCHACLCFDFPRSAVVVYCHALFSHSLFLCFILFSFFFYISLPLFRLNIPSRKLYLEKGRKRKEGKNCIALSVEKMRGINFCIYCIVRSIIGSKEYEEYDIFFILILTMRVLIALIRKRKTIYENT